jgi:arylsulfatase A-like enzyme
MYEECQRMPFIVRYPKSIKAGSVTSAISMNIDFGPTFLDYAGVEVPADMQGRSLRPVLDAEGKVPADWREAAYYHFYEYPAEHSVKRHYGIRTADCKLIHFYNDVDQWEMYDMNADPKELNNVYDDPAYADKRAQMHALLEKVQQEYADTDPCEKEIVMYKGDRRFFDRKK